MDDCAVQKQGLAVPIPVTMEITWIDWFVVVLVVVVSIIAGMGVVRFSSRHGAVELLHQRPQPALVGDRHLEHRHLSVGQRRRSSC